MKKPKNGEHGGGTSFHNTRINCTARELIDVAEKFDCEFYEGNNGCDKTNFDFTFKTDEGDIFTVYDWKVYAPLDLDERYLFHIGAKNKFISDEGKVQLFEEILKLRLEK